MITIVGAGPGDLKKMTYEAVEAIKGADRVVAFSRLAEKLTPIREDIVAVKRLSEAEENMDPALHVAVVVSGDPLFFGLAGTFRERGIHVDKVIPGLSSMQCAAAVLNLPWQKMCAFSFHGREPEVELLLKEPLSCVLLDKHFTASDLSKALAAKGAKGRIHGASYLSYEKEKILSASIGEEISIDEELALAVIELELDE
ncbi:precorrin-6y C5,15-methyltransferase (decarboxylating) subunit CbiE [Peptoniphilus sp. EMRHCC_23]|uniref:precorrin-6y C5,15-methyltransferase (decarboxylating) subunit CbiE n=1 Tax=Peptoniphilus rachelemmaiella TaxID=2811779 RepID=UPI001C002D37|nr:precorrin-6y C5,15-methyltransferase (decarboxylating) subunit CbiE [Peptoniphilus rachelemmaiella]